MPTDLAGGMQPGIVAARARDAGAEGVILRVASRLAGAPTPEDILSVDRTEVAGLADVASEVYALWPNRAT